MDSSIKPTLRVVIADDHAVVRTGYRRLLELEPGLQVIAEFADGESAYLWLVEHPADVLILDLSMPGQGGLATLQRLHQRLPRLRVLIFTMHDSPALAAQLLKAGASGYLTKSSPPESLIDAVHQVAAGEQVLSADIAAAMRKGEGDLPHKQLSPREFDVFLLLAQGMAVEQIASQRCLSIKTAANYQTIVRHKLGLNSALEMYRYAQTCGLLTQVS
ncbi:response regulator transcription factor [Rhodanobacter sp. MP1X3]|uniref:response regulator transcription factor n=1 Tax=Rhodanobacter sp. MP1X3 TaxID=2723086 RepID=UPI0016171C4F|nr:response regulator transcription factor [Rhodanobacter sp. MP1X3]MBB6241108.1 DNA-binding NarL/FixJ family response regulator [Rhodanobacter sp. MP1X3]